MPPDPLGAALPGRLCGPRTLSQSGYLVQVLWPSVNPHVPHRCVGHLRCQSKKARGLLAGRGLGYFYARSSLGKGLPMVHLGCQTKRKVYNVLSMGSGLQKGNLKGAHICGEWLTELGNLKGVHIVDPSVSHSPQKRGAYL